MRALVFALLLLPFSTLLLADEYMEYNEDRIDVEDPYQDPIYEQGDDYYFPGNDAGGVYYFGGAPYRWDGSGWRHANRSDHHLPRPHHGYNPGRGYGRR